jgi:chromosome segregation ATPase
VRKELAELRSTHAATNRELERALDINDQSVVEYLAQVRAITDWKNSCSTFQKQLADRTQEFATLSAACEKKDKELAELREGNYYDEFSDETHISRQNRYFRENHELCSEIEELRKTALKCQGDLEDRTRSCNAAEDKLAKQRKTLRRYESIMET